jgi:3D (Asp-Asp-Asp) domain-containing protein
MNGDYRSPIWDKNTYFIGILILGFMIPIFLLALYQYIIDSEVEAKENGSITTTTNLVPAEATIVIGSDEENITRDTFVYYPTEVSEAKESARYAKYIENEDYLPTIEKNNKQIVAAAEDVIKREEATKETYTASKSTPVATAPVEYVAEETTENEAEEPEEEVTEEEPVTEESTESESSDEGYTYYATYSLTAYCATGSACADGVMPSVGYTVASNDPNLWHKWIYIEGVGDRYVHDRGGMASTVIDVFMGSYGECIQFGRRSAKIYVYN